MDREVFVAVEHSEALDIDANLSGWVGFDSGRQRGDVLSGGCEARDPEGGRVAEEDLGETLGNDRAESEAVERLRRVLARRPASEVRSGKQNTGSLEAFVIERVLFRLPSRSKRTS